MEDDKNIVAEALQTKLANSIINTNNSVKANSRWTLCIAIITLVVALIILAMGASISSELNYIYGKALVNQ